MWPLSSFHNTSPHSLRVGLYISDNVALAEEMIKSFNRKATPRRACISTDITKAFDIVDWMAIKKTLQGMGFSASLIKVLEDCYRTKNLLYPYRGGDN